MQVKSLSSSKGNKVPNQFEIETPEGIYFQSYKTVIAFRNLLGEVTLDKDAWNYSTTTSRYRNLFLGATTQEVKARIKSGKYKLADLNDGRAVTRQ